MKNVERSILYQKAADLRHYRGVKTHYLFDNVDMQLYEVADFPEQYANSKFVPRNLFNLPEQKIPEQPRNHSYSVIIELTNDCNLRCTYCYRQQNLKNDFMTMETADTLIAHFVQSDEKKLFKGKRISIIFFGGEPLMNMPVLKYLVERLRNSIKNYEVRFGIVTNGVLLSKENLEYLIENKIGVKISFEGDELLQGKLRPAVNGKNTYRIIRENIENISPEKRYLFMIAVSVSRHADKLSSILKTYVDMGIEMFNLQMITDDMIGKNNIRLKDLENIKKAIDDTIRLYTDLTISGTNIRLYPVSDMMNTLHNRAPQGYCYSSVDIETYGCDGSIYACQRFLSDTDYVLGNIRTGYDQKKLEKFREYDFLPDIICSGCWMKQFCSGQCLYKKSIPLDDEKSITACLLQNMLWESVINGYIYLKEHTNKPLGELLFD